MNITDIIKIAINSSENLSKEKRKECIKYINDLQQENARLKDKIDKAVEYIKTNCKEWENDDYDVTLYYSLNQNECDELLEILKET